jgi:hypothetical protein
MCTQARVLKNVLSVSIIEDDVASLSEGSARGEAFRRKPKDVRTPEGREKVASFGNLWRFLRKARTSCSAKIGGTRDLS